MLKPLYWDNGELVLFDQTRLPEREAWLRLKRWEEVAEAIEAMRVRGAPAIGIAAAYGLALAIWHLPPGEPPEPAFERARAGLASTRPTAVNLFWALERMKRVFLTRRGEALASLKVALLAEAERLQAEDIAANKALGRLGAELLPQQAVVLTICNTGSLATGGYGTALGVVRAAWEAGKLARAYVCETRPRLQGARLTAWELLRDGIPFRLLVDSAAGWLLRSREVSAVLVGADRIALNGDTANKIGTYTLAVLARQHGIPFYVVATTSTIDPKLSRGKEIPIEYRSAAEVLAPYGLKIAPQDAPAWNPAFDVTPADLITGIVTEKGIARPPYETSLAALIGAD